MDTIFLNNNNNNNFINENAFLFKDYNFLAESTNNLLSEDAILLEGAKFDIILKNFIKEGKDYKGLKAVCKDAVMYYNLDVSQLASQSSGFIHFVKRYFQITQDIGAIIVPIAGIGSGVKVVAGMKMVNSFSAAFGVAGVGSGAIAGGIIFTALITIISYLINRLIRYFIDKAEYRQCVKDAEMIIKNLEILKSKTQNKKEQEKIQNSINRIKDTIEKTSKKSKK